MTSARLDRCIEVDGKDIDWTGVNLYSIDKPQIVMGVLNDDQYLYLIAKTHDRFLSQTLFQKGLTVWFDPEARKKQVFGVRFPIILGLQGFTSGVPGGEETRYGRAQGPASMNDGELREGEQQGKPEVFSEGKIDSILNRSRYLEILGFEKEDHRVMTLAQADSLGITVHCSYGHGLLTYELRVPLKTDQQHHYGIGLAVYDSVEHVSLGLVAGSLLQEMQGKRPPMGGMGMPSGRPGGMMGGPQGGPGGPGRPRGGEKPQELEYWTKVALHVKVQ